MGTPRISRVRDLGTRQPPQSGPLLGESDGVAAPGEFLLIEGWGFGKSPAVTVDGKAAEVVARTVGAGIVARVPGGVGVGSRAVEVAVGEAKSVVKFALRRLVVSLHGGVLRADALDGEALAPVGSRLPLRGARAMVMAADGSYAYVLTSKQLLIVDLGAAGGPKLVNTRDLTVPATQLVAPLRAARVIAVAAGALQIFEITDPRAPAPYQPTTLPNQAKGFTRAEVDPDGNRLALMIPEGNHVVLVDIAKPARPHLLGDVPVLPEARVPLLRDLRFSPDGDSVWVVSGDGPGSLSIGTQPTRLSVVKLEQPEGAPSGADVQVSPWRIAQLPSAWPPLRLVAARAPPVASGATIRLPPEKTQVRFASVAGALLPPGAAATADPLQGAIDSGDATGEGARILEPRLLLGSSFGTPDDGALVATAVRALGSQREWGLAVVTFSKPATHSFTPRGPAIASDLAPPFALGDIAVQP